MSKETFEAIGRAFVKVMTVDAILITITLVVKTISAMI